jgi:hypothetical protein
VNRTEQGYAPAVNQEELAPGERLSAPQVVRTYATYLWVRTGIKPEVDPGYDLATVKVTIGERTLKLLFRPDQQGWSLHSAKVRHGELTEEFVRGELPRAADALLGGIPANSRREG